MTYENLTRNPMGLLRHLGLIMFLVSYLFLTVLGNLLYFLPFGDHLGQQTVADFSIDNFPSAGSGGYWALLFLPFVVTPPIVFLVEKVVAPAAREVATLPAFSKVEYASILMCSYAFAAWSLWRTDALGLLLRARNFEGAVQDRFDLLAALGFWPLAVMKSILFALSCYGFIRMLTGRDTFWTVVAGFNLMAMSLVLLLLNMKWPLVLFYLAHLVAIILFSRRKLVPSIVFIALACTSYFSTSLLLMRASVSPLPSITLNDKPSDRREKPSTVIGLAAGAILNRMAQPFPYYYEMFVNSEGKCGSLLTRIMRKPSPCQPSIVVYSAMFSDRFSGTGTAPQAAHVTGFALSGWAGAIVELIAVSIVLGLFGAVAGSSTPWQATITVLGALSGYYFSQLPFEGPLVYDHGILWWGLLLLAFVGYAKMRERKRPSLHKEVKRA